MSFIFYDESIWNSDKLYCYEKLSYNTRYNLFRAQYKKQDGVLIKAKDDRNFFIGSDIWSPIYADQIIS